MSVNTSDEYLDELLQAIEPIIYPNGPEIDEEPQMDLIEEPIMQSVAEMSQDSESGISANVSTEIPMETVSENIMDTQSTDVENIGLYSDAITLDDSAEAEMGESQADISRFLAMDEETSGIESGMSEGITDTYTEADDSSLAIGDLLASLAMEGDDNNETGMSEEDIESMLDAVSNPIVEDEPANYDQDVKDLLKLFTEDEDLSDIQDMLDKNDNGEALDESLLDMPDVEVFKLEEEAEESEEEEALPKGSIFNKLAKGFSSIFKRKKKQNTNEEESDEQENAVQFEEITTESEIESEDIEEISLLDSLVDDDVEELVLDEDMSDIEMLLSGGALQGSGASDLQEDNEEEKTSDAKKKKNKKGKKDKKESFFSKVLNMLTEEIETPAKENGGVPETGATGITDENRDILEQLSKEDKKKAKLEKKNAKKNGSKKSSKKGDDKEDADAKGKKAKKPKKEKKKREKKEKPRKAEVISKPEKKLPKKRVLSALALCFSILAAVLILQNVVSETDNLKEAEYAFDTADYATCFANLSTIERDEEAEALYQKSFIIMSVQRKLDSYYNFMQMNNEVEALNSLLEGVVVYRKQEAAASEWGVQGQILAIYQTICEKLQEYGLTEADIDEILGYESRVTYTKRLDSIVNGTPFAIEDMMEGFEISEPQPFEDVLPWEEDFLPEDTTTVTSEQMVTGDEGTVSEENENDSYVEQGQTVVVSSNPVDISESSQDDLGGQNIGNGGTDVSIEVDGGNIVVGDM